MCTCFNNQQNIVLFIKDDKHFLDSNGLSGFTKKIMLN